ncbi:MAG: hypothetical protein M3144_10690, partial [Actinomycetota bacterium]|nr:hypothetical protein [Actinomycetota bacterium]
VEDTYASKLLDRREAPVAGNRAVRVETAATGAALLPEGTRGVRYYVDFGPRTLVATTLETAEAGTFRSNTEVLDRMLATLTELDAGDISCSAARLPATVSPAPELPGPVAATRNAILHAAAACDYKALAELALAGEGPFTYSFGDRGAPAEFWQHAEARGEDALATLVELLSLPFATRATDGTMQYLWPSAYAYERWADVPAAHREALRRLYDEDDLRRFQEFGTYSGHRVGITEAGDWLFFVGGD